MFRFMAIDRRRFNVVGEEKYTAGKLVEIMQMFSPQLLIGPIATLYSLPQHMGLWCTNEGQTGPFFMWIKGSNPPNFFGRIEDEIGSAVFEGTIGSNKLDFVKTYARTIERPITYHAVEKRNGIYLGTYRFGEGNGSHDGCFLLEDYTPSDTLNAIVANICEKNKRR